MTAIVRRIFILLIVFLFSGCAGGGTSGTGGGRTISLRGEIVSQDFSPIQNVSIRSLADNQEVMTRRDGSFEMKTEVDPDAQSFEIIASQNNSSEQLQPITVTIPQESNNISVQLQVRIRDGNFVLVSIDIKDQDSKEPAPLTTPTITNEQVMDSNSGAISEQESKSVISREHIFRGILLAGDQPLQGALISIPAISKQTVKSNSNGEWTMTTSIPTEPVTLTLRVPSEDLKGDIELLGLPKKPSIISLTLQIPEPAEIRSSLVPRVPLKIVRLKIRRRSQL